MRSRRSHQNTEDRKAAGFDNIPAELILQGGGTVTDILHKNVQHDLADRGMTNILDEVSLSHYPRKAIYNYAKITERSA